MKKLLLKLQSVLLKVFLEIIDEMNEDERIEIAEQEKEQYDCYKKSFKGNKRFVDENIVPNLSYLNKNSSAKVNHIHHILKYYNNKKYLINRRKRKQAKREMRLAYYN